MSNGVPSLGRKTISGTFWIYVARYSGKFFVFISTVILARLLLQSDFGVAGYALSVIGILEVLQGLGVGAALIYFKGDPDRTTTAFWLGLLVGVSLFAITWFLAPLTGLFFEDPRAVAVTRVLGFTFPLTALGDVHGMLLYKELAFRRSFLPEIGRAAGKGIAAIVLALAGLGAWSLIYGQLAGVIAGVILYWLVIPWRPTLRFNLAHARGLLTYGTHLSANDLLAVLLVNADYLLIGRYLGAAALGIYTLAFRVPELLVKEFSGAVGKVIFPVYAQMRDEPENLRRGFLLTLRYVNLITVPMSLGLALVARPFVLTFFTEKWVEAIPVMQGIAIYTLLRALVFNSGDVYKALGRPGLLAQIKAGQIIMTLPALWWAVTEIGNLVAVAWMQAALVLIAGLVKLVIAGHVLEVQLRKMGAALWPSLLAGTTMSGIVVVVLHLTAALPPWLQLTASVSTGVFIYLLILFFLEQELVTQAIARLRRFFQDRSTTEVYEA